MMTIWRSIAALLLALGATDAAASNAPELRLWRLDCGGMIIDDISYFSDAFAYEGRPAEIGNGCYLIQHGDAYMLWDAGLPRDYLNNKTADEDGWLSFVTVTIADQLALIGVTPDQINFLGLSHFHGDHVGQADEFQTATLLISGADASAIRGKPSGNASRRLAPWFGGGSTMIEFSGDHDVFGDGSVIILATPGHTPGHSSLLIRLKETGPIILTGDLFHFRSEIGRRNVSRWNTSRADTLASIERFEGIVENLRPVVIVQHDNRDIGRLPAFPKAAR
ncbi:MAG: N-acyl homoserine lactonase family protein [Parvularculaceae bacterium]